MLRQDNPLHSLPRSESMIPVLFRSGPHGLSRPSPSGSGVKVDCGLWKLYSGVSTTSTSKGGAQAAASEPTFSSYPLDEPSTYHNMLVHSDIGWLSRHPIGTGCFGLLSHMKTHALADSPESSSAAPAKTVSRVRRPAIQSISRGLHNTHYLVGLPPAHKNLGRPAPFLALALLRASRANAASELEGLLEKLLLEPAPAVKAVVNFLLGLCADEDKEPLRTRTADEWAAEFLHLPLPPRTSTASYFAKAERNAYAQRSPTTRLLMLAAAAYAWKLREKDADFAVPGSLRESLKSFSPEARQSWASNTAAYHEHSYDIEGAPLDRQKLQACLEEATI